MREGPDIVPQDAAVNDLANDQFALEKGREFFGSRAIHRVDRIGMVRISVGTGDADQSAFGQDTAAGVGHNPGVSDVLQKIGDQNGAEMPGHQLFLIDRIGDVPDKVYTRCLLDVGMDHFDPGTTKWRKHFPVNVRFELFSEHLC